ncbi:MAG: Crp/Fnr family transcriptional regulator [Anaerolineae bacterium]|nr:Crp/Fnr family transcriptional regulator [Anaerolineae bacterium]
MDTGQSPVQVSEILRLAAFRTMPEAQLERIAAALVRHTYAPGQLIFLEGEPPGGLWFVAEGRVKIIKQSLNGRIQAICLVNRGKCFGSCPLFHMDHNPATAQALDEVTLFVLPQDALERLGGQDALLSSALMRIYSQRLDHLARLTESLGTWSVGDRINHHLLANAEPDGKHTVVTLTHEKLAMLSGTVRETVTRHLARLERVGAVRSDLGRITLVDASALTLPCVFDGDDAAR